MPNYLFTAEDIARAIPYEAYKSKVESLAAAGQVTGSEQSESLLKYTQLNIQRMNRLEKTAKIPASLQMFLAGMQRRVVLVVLTEGWCGDAAQIMPVVEKMTQLTDALEQRVLLRDENAAIMDHYTSNGARSIPKFIALDAETMEELFVWGSRPAVLQKLYADLREQGVSGREIAEQIHLWYARDKSAAICAEFEHLLTVHAAATR